MRGPEAVERYKRRVDDLDVGRQFRRDSEHALRPPTRPGCIESKPALRASSPTAGLDDSAFAGEASDVRAGWKIALKGLVLRCPMALTPAEARHNHRLVTEVGEMADQAGIPLHCRTPDRRKVIREAEDLSHSASSNGAALSDGSPKVRTTR